MRSVSPYNNLLIAHIYAPENMYRLLWCEAHPFYCTEMEWREMENGAINSAKLRATNQWKLFTVLKQSQRSAHFPFDHLTGVATKDIGDVDQSLRYLFHKFSYSPCPQGDFEEKGRHSGLKISIGLSEQGRNHNCRTYSNTTAATVMD